MRIRKTYTTFLQSIREIHAISLQRGGGENVTFALAMAQRELAHQRRSRDRIARFEPHSRGARIGRGLQLARARKTTAMAERLLRDMEPVSAWSMVWGSYDY